MSLPFIELHNLSRWYGTYQALRNISLTLPAGRIGLLGPNGAGKSTLIKILLGLLAPSTGTGKLLGQSLLPEELTSTFHFGKAAKELSHDLFGPGSALRRAIGYMPEADSLIPGMRGANYVALAGELCGMPRKQALRRAHEVLTYLGLEDARYRHLEEYSLGMKQRLKLAQALVHDPPVLLLDEPTSGLDPAGRDSMLKLLLTLSKDFGKSLLLCTHLLGDVERVCETVVILNRGEVLCHGPVKELCQNRHDRYYLRIQGDAHSFLNELHLEGVNILHNNGKGEIRVQTPENWVRRAFFVLADAHNVLIRGLQQDDEDLEELFHRVLEEQAENVAEETDK